MTIYLKPCDIKLTINKKNIYLPMLNESESKFNLSLDFFDHFLNVRLKFCLLNTKENINLARNWYNKSEYPPEPNKIQLLTGTNNINSHEAYLINGIQSCNIPECCFQVEFMCLDLRVSGV